MKRRHLLATAAVTALAAALYVAEAQSGVMPCAPLQGLISAPAAKPIRPYRHPSRPIIHRIKHPVIGASKATPRPTACLADPWSIAAIFPGGNPFIGLWPETQPSNSGGDPSQCFLKGTLIRTIGCWKPVEECAVGDGVWTLPGYGRVIEVKRYEPRNDPPVRIKAHALALGSPTSDLLISQFHCLFIDGVFVQAIDLVNGTSIVREPPGEYEYFHIVLQKHSVIYANGAATESLHVLGEQRADVVRFTGRADRLKSRIRRLVAPVFDRRTKLDRIIDRINARA